MGVKGNIWFIGNYGKYAHFQLCECNGASKDDEGVRHVTRGDSALFGDSTKVIDAAHSIETICTGNK